MRYGVLGEGSGVPAHKAVAEGYVHRIQQQVVNQVERLETLVLSL